MSISVLIIGSLVLLFIVYSYLTMRKAQKMESVPDSEKIVTLTKANFDHQIQNGIVLVDFWASWCMPCKMLAPVINEIADEIGDKIKIGKVNVEEEKEIASRFSIKGIPTLILFKDGNAIKRFVGVKSKSYYLKRIQEVQLISTY